MPSQLLKIKELIPFLPKSDIPYATKFYNDKDWESLKDLTWSAWERYKWRTKNKGYTVKYADLDADKLAELALECNEYYYLIYPWEEEIEDDFEGDEDTDEEEF